MTEPVDRAGRNDPKQAFIVSHTHWDREWYHTYDRFRVSLVRVVEQVLNVLENDEAFEHFLLDGQAVILEDYLEVRPANRDRIVRLVEDGKLSIGPWYVLPDEFLVSAEATVRNIRIGHRACMELGRVQKVGYMPDSFGHIAQMPQILRQAGIDSFVYTRGNGEEIHDLGAEFLWEAPDGSVVLAINQCGGYCNAGGLGFAEEWEAHTQRSVDLKLAVTRIGELFAQMRKLSHGDVYLINNGCDHFPPQQKLGQILASLRQEFAATEFLHSDLPSYLDAVRTAGFVEQRYRGELAKGRLHHILSGVWSARMYLKQHNDRAQRLLSYYAEPLAAYSHFMRGESYPAGLIDASWKLLLKNHPHDSICGCSTDRVHRAMGPRFDSVCETAEQLIRERLVQLTPTFATDHAGDASTVICVANPLPVARTAVVERLVVLQSFGIDVDRLELLDQDGNSVPFAIIDTGYVQRFWGVDYRTELSGETQVDLFQVYRDEFANRIGGDPGAEGTRDCFIILHFMARGLPGLGHRQFYLCESPGKASLRPLREVNTVRVGQQSIENEFYQVQVHPDGTFDLVDKQGGHSYTGLNRLEDTEDVGDEYDYSPATNSQTIRTTGIEGELRTVRDSGLWGQLEVAYGLQLPRAVDRDRTSRTDDLVDCRVRTRIGLKQGSRAVEVEVFFDNLVHDHRLRAEFPTGIRTETVISDGHFHVNHRPVDQPDGRGWRQPPAGTYPQQDFSLVQDGARGLAILNKGLPEIQPIRNGAGEVSLSLTLLRAVGWLSRDDIATRRCENAGPTLATPEAQCLGEHRFEYAVVPFVGDYLRADVKGISQMYRIPNVAVQGVEDGHVPGGPGLLSKANPATCVSAVKRHDERDTLELRLYNLGGETVVESLNFGTAIVGGWRTDLLGERRDALELADESRLSVSLGPHEIVTLEIEFSSP